MTTSLMDTTGRRERTSGMDMSSMKNVILLPFGGPARNDTVTKLPRLSLASA